MIIEGRKGGGIRICGHMNIPDHMTSAPKAWVSEFERFLNLPEPEQKKYEDLLPGRIRREEEKLDAQLAPVAAEIHRILESGQQNEANKSVLGRFFFGPQSFAARRATDELWRLGKENGRIEKEFRRTSSLDCDKFMVYYIQRHRDENKRSAEHRARLAAKEASAKAKQARKEQLEAAAAAHFGKTREEADKIKRRLQDQVSLYANCPYCNGAMDGTLHADHIYPVVKGGLSTTENMVFVCESCNLKKHDKTLREFILQTGYDRDRIERALHQLGKRF
ncbi:MAG: HNH endonuclease signature motif containing protein [Thermoguttaceae bacterium]|jgi:5-methylcytosine-specific restriction endonuclease McrA